MYLLEVPRQDNESEEPAVKNINVTLEDRVHARLKAFARENTMTLADALRYALDHCLPPLRVPESKSDSDDSEDGASAA